jgi:hypothetical protein
MQQWIAHHLVLLGVIGTWLFNNIITVLVSSLDAPTKDSSARYRYWFKVLNSVIGNVARAKSTALELSPNWQAAMDAHLAKVAASPAIQQIVTAAIAANNQTAPPPSETRS